MKKIFVISLVLSCLALTACTYGTDNIFKAQNLPNNRIKRLENIAKEETPADFASDFNVLVLTDVHIGSRKYDVDTSIKNLNAWLDAQTGEDKVKFCLVLGDLADHGWEEEFKAYTEFISSIEARGIKVYNIVGNHDLYNSGWDYWKEYCYPQKSFYKFETSGFSWYFLDSGSGIIGDKQYAFLRQDMEQDTNPKIILNHYALVCNDTLLFALRETSERNRLIKLFSENNAVAYLCGHYHPYVEQSVFNYFDEYCLSSFGQYQTWAVMTVKPDQKTIKIKEIK